MEVEKKIDGQPSRPILITAFAFHLELQRNCMKVSRHSACKYFAERIATHTHVTIYKCVLATYVGNYKNQNGIFYFINISQDFSSHPCLSSRHTRPFFVSFESFGLFLKIFGNFCPNFWVKTMPRTTCDNLILLICSHGLRIIVC